MNWTYSCVIGLVVQSAKAVDSASATTARIIRMSWDSLGAAKTRAKISPAAKAITM